MFVKLPMAMCLALTFATGCSSTTQTTLANHTSTNKASINKLAQPIKNQVTFNLRVESLEQNLRRLLGNYNQYNNIYWNVSTRHQVVASATVSGDDLYQLIDKIIAPYKQPAQIRATFYRANGVVTFDYNRLMAQP